MRRKDTILSAVLLLVLIAVSGTVSLNCYSCNDAFSLGDCNSTEECEEEQVCYKRRQLTSSVQFDLGCIDKELCDRRAKISADQTSYCYECCSKDRCNEDLCEYPPNSLCKDDRTVDCAKMNLMFRICEVKSQAKKICPKFCNLCNLVDGKWASWSPWSKCDVTCGEGTLLRHRTCSDPAPQNGGEDCPGNGTESKVCELKPCPVHGGWSSWDDWGKCSATCGVGMRSRTRSCSNPRPQLFGDHCFGDRLEDELCNSGSCAVHGGWSSWGNWGKCSATCGVGMRSRKRSCSNPRPQLFGDHCFGDSIEDELCNSGSCAVDGGWSDWSNWGKCSVSCGVGLQSRSLSCTNPAPQNAGRHCIGQNFDVKLCYPLCPGEWDAWQSWSECSGPCGQKVQTRQRKCKNNPFTLKCEGNSSVIRNCDASECYTDCKEVMKHMGKKPSGVYNVNLWKSKRTISVYCDFDTGSGGWTVFQYRFDGGVDFYRRFNDYERGFGTLNGEFWLGLRNIYEMVSERKTELRIDLTAADGTTVYETFQNFRLGDSPYYTLHIDKGVGTAGDDQGLSYNNGRKFSTYDVDQDGYSSTNCAVDDHGGWWYNYCTHANLNGEYVTPGTERSVGSEGGMIYKSFKGLQSLWVSKMMFRSV